ncbi:hypothetical protein DKE44_020530 (plasmid) [Acinetobacter nosocomialis]|nr:hypothetical protein DKE44_020530 [Acinetobacter nosocomialis]
MGIGALETLMRGKRILEAPKYFESPVKMAREINSLSLYKFSGAPIYETSTELNIVGLSIFLRTNIAPDSMKHSFGLVQRVGKRLTGFTIFVYIQNISGLMLIKRSVKFLWTTHSSS